MDGGARAPSFTSRRFRLMTNSRRWLSLLLALGLAFALRAADPPAKSKIDFSKLPPGTIFVVGEEGKDVQQQPGIVVLSQEKFKVMQDQLEQLRKQAVADKPEPPSQCHLTVKVALAGGLGLVRDGL